MKAQEFVDKIIQFYSDPDNHPGIDPENNVPTYYWDDNTRCAIGCLLNPEDAEILQDYSTHRNIYLISRWIKLISSELESADPLIPEIPTKERQKVSNLISFLTPEDIPSHKVSEFLDSLQKAHDKSLDFVCSDTDHSVFVDCLKKQLTIFLAQFEVVKVN